MHDTSSQQFDDERLSARIEGLEAKLHECDEVVDHTSRLAALGTLTSMIAHEFRSLLTPIRGYAELAQRHPDDPELLRRALDQAARAAEQATSIADSILELTASNQVVHATNLHEAVDNALGHFRGAAGVRLTNRLPEQLFALIDPADLGRVLFNLIQNAIEAMPDGGRVEVSLAECSTWNTHALEIRDSGSGVRPGLLGSIFEPHVSGRGGAGLGLAVCRRLVERAGGSIAVESEPGRGSSFRVTLAAAE